MGASAKRFRFASEIFQFASEIFASFGAENEPVRFAYEFALAALELSA